MKVELLFYEFTYLAKDVDDLMGALQLILAEGKGAKITRSRIDVSTLWLELNALYD